jgi:type IV pilus assembly protein PilM
MNSKYFYQDKPVFGLDIGYGSVKIMQIEWAHKHQVVTGYGVTTFRPECIKDGVIADVEALAKAVYDLFSDRLIGEITTRRTALSIPAARTFTRPMSLPKLARKDLDQAVRLEAEQYIPMPIDELYIDYTITRKTDKGIDLLAVAAPKKLVDSYMALARVLGLDVVALETTIGAAGRLFVQAEQSDVPTVLIDFGSISADITIYDKDLIVTGTVPCGGDIFSDIIAKELGTTRAEAQIIKTKYGLGVSKKQAQITKALTPELEKLLKEVRRMIRYYEERSGSQAKIGQIVTMGGGANMPGLSEFMTSHLRLPVRMCDPWQNLKYGGLQPPNPVEKSMYVTVAGLALLNPREVFA